MKFSVVTLVNSFFFYYTKIIMDLQLYGQKKGLATVLDNESDLSIRQQCIKRSTERACRDSEGDLDQLKSATNSKLHQRETTGNLLNAFCHQPKVQFISKCSTSSLQPSEFTYISQMK
jgi:hypothetical protein